MIPFATAMRPFGQHCEVEGFPVRLFAVAGIAAHVLQLRLQPLPSHHLPFSAGAGFLVGGTVGILRSSKTPVLWTLATTIQWALLGGSYCGKLLTLFSRTIVLTDLFRNTNRNLGHAEARRDVSTPLAAGKRSVRWLVCRPCRRDHSCVVHYFKTLC
jgi:hypothetical protein